VCYIWCYCVFAIYGVTARVLYMVLLRVHYIWCYHTVLKGRLRVYDVALRVITAQVWSLAVAHTASHTAPSLTCRPPPDLPLTLHLNHSPNPSLFTIRCILVRNTSPLPVPLPPTGAHGSAAAIRLLAASALSSNERRVVVGVCSPGGQEASPGALPRGGGTPRRRSPRRGDCRQSLLSFELVPSGRGGAPGRWRPSSDDFARFTADVLLASLPLSLSLSPPHPLSSSLVRPPGGGGGRDGWWWRRRRRHDFRWCGGAAGCQRRHPCREGAGAGAVGEGLRTFSVGW